MKVQSLASLLEKLEEPISQKPPAEHSDGPLPLLVWAIRDLDARRSVARGILRALHRRGLGMIITWHPVIVDATRCMHLICGGSPEAAHGKRAKAAVPIGNASR